jgi:predicted DNA-binding protein (UPF0251 family)
MARPLCPRRVDALPRSTYFKPRGVPVKELEQTVLSVDELEALRLADLEGLYHEEAAARMNVSRATFGRIVETARRKVAEVLVRGRALKIEGGVVERPALRHFACASCRHQWSEPFGTGRPGGCPRCAGNDFQRTDRGPRGQECRARAGEGQGRGGQGRSTKQARRKL